MGITKINIFFRPKPAATIGFAVLLVVTTFIPGVSISNAPAQDSMVIDSVLDWAKGIMQTSSSEEARQILDEWILPDAAPSPNNKPLDPKKVALGKMLFFDPRLSGNGTMSCATCHNPALGWSDGLPTGRGHEGMVLERATPTIINVAYNKIFMWDGREKSLESQATGPIVNPNEMHNTVDNMIKTLKGIPGYVKAFNDAFYGLGINVSRYRTAIAQFQRSVVVQNSPFDRWIRGDASAMTAQQVRGFELFRNPGKGNCMVCHRPPNFTDNGFHNIGLPSFGENNPDLGRHDEVKVDMTRGAFKTPPLRNIAQTAPYFHDGSAKTLGEVIDHYISGGVVQSNLSPNMIKPNLTKQDKQDLVAFLEALTGEVDPVLAQVNLPK
ncbi:cytochrome-c peroxidase [Kaarinaea lacus]